LNDIREAAARIAPYAHKTPVLTSSSFNAMFGGVNLFFKCENFQKVGAFKFRGACNAIFSLTDEEAENGVATHSSGNHAQAVALASSLRRIKSFIVMPKDASKIKREATESYGGEITNCQNTLESRDAILNEVVKRTGAHIVHPYNDDRVIVGQATASLELIEEVPGLDFIICPVGGGGLISGTCLTAKYLSPNTRVIGVEPENADDAKRSLNENHIVINKNANTICDGLRASLGDKTFEIIKTYVNQIVTVSDASTIEAMKLIWQRLKIVVEPSSAVVVAALLEKKITFTKNQRIGLILSGGNVELKY
jgi:threonine dehydratase